jgi:hypothetical protein
MKLRLSLFKVRHLSNFFARGSSAIYLFTSNHTKRIDSDFKTHTQPLVFRRFFTMSKWVFVLKHGYSNWIITLHETHTQPLVFRRFVTMSKWVFAFKHGYSNWIITFSLRCRPWITHRQLESLECHRWVFEPRKELIARSVQFQNSAARTSSIFDDEEVRIGRFEARVFALNYHLQPEISTMNHPSSAGMSKMPPLGVWALTGISTSTLSLSLNIKSRMRLCLSYSSIGPGEPPCAVYWSWSIIFAVALGVSGRDFESIAFGLCGRELRPGRGLVACESCSYIKYWALDWAWFAVEWSDKFGSIFCIAILTCGLGHWVRVSNILLLQSQSFLGWTLRLVETLVEVVASNVQHSVE